MNADEINFAYKIRHALNEQLEVMPASSAERLANARKMALSRKKKDHPLRAFVHRGVLATAGGSLSGANFGWIARMSVAVPLLVLAFGLVGLYQNEEARHIRETADIDAAVLTDDLPLTAYVDHGFNAYLAKRVD